MLRRQQAQTAQGLRRLEALGTSHEQPNLKVMADAGYSNGAQAEALEAQGVVAHIPANRAVNNQGKGEFFDRTSFAYDEASDTLRCQAGKTLQRKQLQRGQHRVLYAAEIGDRGTCVLRACCKNSPRRFVARHLHARATPELMQLRCRVVEHPFASLKYRILEKPRVQIQKRGRPAERGVLVT